jgi:hypothetical protein
MNCKTMRRLAVCSFVVVLLPSLGRSAPSATREVTSPRITAAINFDGRLDEPSWDQAGKLGRLVTLGDEAQTERYHTEARVTHNGEALFIAVQCLAETTQGDLQPRGRDDRSVYQRDHVEIFLDPSPETEDYFQLVVGKAGTKRDSRNNAPPGEPEGGEWNGDWEAATAPAEGGWSLEVIVPFADLGAPVPQPGSMWRLKVCRGEGGEGNLCWPANRTMSFHARSADGALYFETTNLLANPDFEDGADVTLVPPPWSATMTSAEVNNAVQGTVETVAGAGVEPDSRAVRMTKLSSAMWWPQIWSPGHQLKPGATYEFSVMAQGTLPQINLRANFMVHGDRVKISQSFETPATWQRLRYAFSVPEGNDVVNVGLAAPRVAGEIWFDKAVLKRTLASADASRAPKPLSAEPDPDPVQGLDAFMERHGHKPYDLFEDAGKLKSLRLIFRDRKFGTPVWMLDTSPTVAHCGTASVWSAWNPIGSTIYTDGSRPLGEETPKSWYFNADFSRLTPAVGGRPAVWSPDDPYVFYGPIGPSSNVTRTNLRTGTEEAIAEWEPLRWPSSTMRIYGLTRDQRHVFVDIPNRGIFVPFQNDPDHPIPVQSLYDGRPMGPGPRSIGSNHSAVIYGHEDYGDMIALRTGMLVDRQTGEMTYIAAPLCGNTNYLRAFHENRVKYPEGKGWDTYGIPWFAKGVQLPTGLSMDELYELWLSLPHVTHGHESPSPDWQYIASDGGRIPIVRVRDGQTRYVQLSPNGGNYHLSWGRHPRFFIGWVRGWQFGNCLRPQSANIEFQVFADTTFQPIVDTKHRFNGYYSGGDFSMLSPDATKIHYGSSMTGRFRNYIAVMARPRPPKELSLRADDGEVVLSWKPSAYSHETRGYLVRRSDVSGGPYKLLTPEPVEGTVWRDDTAQAGMVHCYVVSALEHSGIESGYSLEAVQPALSVAGPLVVYAEAEDAVRDLPTDALPGLAMGVDRVEASDWAYIYRHPEAGKGQAALSLHVPAAGQYFVWARLASVGSERGEWQVSLGSETVTVKTYAEAWTWVRADQGPVPLSGGPLAVRLETEDAPTRMDLVCLTTNADFVPEGARPENRTPPPPPSGLRAENVRERVNRLAWTPAADPAFAHYQVYGSREAGFKPSQETLLGSPTYEEFVDWGLKAGTRYYYAVTVVSRRGSESPAVRAEAATPPRTDPVVEIQLAFAEAELSGAFERKEGGGLRGPAFVVAENPKESSVTWRVEIPRGGDYYLWLRHLLRGKGGRGPDVRQSVRVRANGETVATLGGGRTDLNVRDSLLAKDHPMAPQVWTWAWPGTSNLAATKLPAGEVDIVLDQLAPNVRYDVLLITNEPSFYPQDGRIRQR